MRKASKWARALMVYILCIAITFTMTPVNLIAWGADETNQQTEQAQEAASEDVQQDGQNAEQFGENDQTSSDQSGDQAEEPAADDQNAASADSKADSKEEAADTDNAKSDAVTNSNADNDAADPKGKESIKEDSDKAKEKAKDEYPAAELSGSAGSVSVSIRAPKGALPKGAKLVVSPVSASEVKDAVGTVVDGKITKIKAVDITFYDKDGNEIEPKKNVSVVMRAPGVDRSADNQDLVHIDNGGGASIVEGAEVSKSGTASFESNDFSYYVIVSSNEDGTNNVEVISDVTEKGIEVTITGNSNVLPEGTKLVVTDSDSPSKEDLSAATGKNISDVQAVNISLQDKDGNALSLSGEVDVKVEGSTVSGMVFTGGNYNDSIGNSTSCEFKTNSPGEVVFAAESQEYEVKFIVKGDNNDDETTLQTFSKESGEKIGTLPQAPFKKGYRFVGWFMKDGESTIPVTEDTVVDKDITAYAEFSEIKVNTAVIEYYYEAPNVTGEKLFDTNIIDVDLDDLPKEVESPSNVGVGDDDPKYDTYYPEQPVVTIEKSDFATDSVHTYRVKYVPYTATYDYVYMLKNLVGNGYTEYARDKDIEGVLGSTVTAPAKQFDHMKWTNSETVLVKEKQGTEIHSYYERENCTLSYNTLGGSYVAAQNGKFGQEMTVSATKPTRQGYTFDGWYLDKEYTKKAGTTVELSGDVTLYAKWKGDQADYTIVYMFEKYNDTGTESSYVYDNSETRTAETGTTVKATDKVIPDKTRKGWEKDSAKNAKSSVEIKADGTSVLYVYYKLTEYTLNFNRNGWGWINKPDGGYTTGIYSFKAKIGQDISGLWPSADSDYVYFTGWQKNGQGDRYVTKQLIMNEDLLPSSDTTVTYYADWTSYASQKTVNYYLENADNNGYTKSDSYSQTYYSSSYGNLNPKEILGYKYDHSANSGNTYNFYYKRNTFKIDYFHGSNNLKTINKVKFDATITSNTYNWTPTHAQCGVDDDYTWGGWYSDSGLTAKYTFSKMPASNLVLYAKWIPPQYTVTYDKNAADASLGKVPESETVSKNEMVSFPGEPERNHYEFTGWYTDKDCSPESLYDWNKPVTDDITLYAGWKLAPLKYTVHYVDTNGDTLYSDKVIESASFELGQKITEEPITISGYRPDADHKEITLATEDNEITFVYAKKTGTISYTVHYVLDSDHSVKVANDKEVTGVSSDKSSVIEVAAAVDKSVYEGDDELYPLENSIEKTLSTGDNDVWFYYTNYRTANLTVEYVDMDGNTIKAEPTEKVKVNSTEQLNLKVPSGYVRHHMEKNGEAITSTSIKVKDTSDITVKVFCQKNLTVVAKGDTKDYDGTPLKFEGVGGVADVIGLAQGHSLADITITGSQTEVGSSLSTPSNALILGSSGKTESDYYRITYVPASLTVKPAEVTITIDPDRYTGITYDGTTHQAGFCKPGKQPADYVSINNNSYKAKYQQNFIDVINAHKVIFSEKDVCDKTEPAGNIRSWFTLPDDKNYKVTFEVREAKLKIDPAAVTVTTGSDSKEYDGSPLTKADASITGIIDSEKNVVKVTATGSQTEVGTSKNTYSIDWGSAKATNYTITETLGDLEVTENTTTVTLTAPSDNKIYDGTALKCDGTGEKKVTASGLPEGFTVEATATGSQTDAGESANVVNDGYIIKDADGKDKTANFKNVTKVDGTLTVNKAPVTITTGSGSKAYDGSALTNAEASIEGLVNGETATVTATGSQTEVGESSNKYSIDWGTTNKDNYEITENLGKLTVTDSNAKVTLTAPSDSKTYDGKALTCDGTEEGKEVQATGLPEGFTVEAVVKGSQTDAGSSANKIDSFVIKNAAGEDKTANFKNVTKVDGKLTVNKAPVTITTGSDSKAFDGMPLIKAEASITGLVNNETATVTATGSQIEVGESSNTYSIDWGNTNKDNYTITENLGTLKVVENSAEVTLTAPSDSKTYDGKALTCDGSGEKKVTASGLPDGVSFVIQATASGSQTDAGNSPNMVENGYKILMTKDGKLVDVTDSFTNITTVNGTLTVDPAEVTITTGSGSKAYDGTALTNSEAKIEGLQNGETAKIEATGSQTEVGSSDNTYKLTWAAEGNEYTAKSGNYTIVKKLGKLEVTNNSAEVTLTAASDSKTYDGKALTNSKVTASGLPDGFTVEATASGSQIDAGESANVVNKGYVIKDAKGADKTANFTNVKKVDGKLTVNKASLTITAKDQTYTYNGQAQGEDNKTYTGESVNEKVNVVGLADGDTLSSVKLNGKETAAGEYADKIAVSDGVVTFGHMTDKKIADNYNVTYVNGKLTITNATLTIKITGNKDELVYNGKTQKVDGFTFSVEADPDNIFVESKVSYDGNATASGKDVTSAGYPMKLDISKFSYADKNVDVKFELVEDGHLTIKPRPVTLTSATDEKEYDGTPLTRNKQSDITVGGDGFADGEGATYTITGSQKVVGSSENKFTYELNDGTLEDNYTITTSFGTLTVTNRNAQYKIEVEANSGTKTYDGTDKTVTGLKEDTFEVEGNTYTVTGLEASGSGKNAGDYPVNVTGKAVVTDADGNVVTEQFAVTTKPGNLKIEKRKVTLTSASGEKEYDGTPLTKNAQSDVTVSGEGFAKGEGATYNITGSQTVKGSSKNTFTYTLNEGTLADNYTIKTVEGDLNVIDRTNKYKIEVESNSGEYVYDDQEHEASGFKKDSYEVDGQVYTVEGLTASVSGRNADTYTNTISGEAVVKDAAGNVVTDQFTVTKKEGTLTIKPRPVTFTGDTATKDYTGEEIELTDVKPSKGKDEGLVEGHKDNVKYSAKGTEVGSYNGTITDANDVKITKDGEDVTANYDITTIAGKLTIQQTNEELTVSLGSKSYVYDDEAHKLPSEATTNAKSGETKIEYRKAATEDAEAGEWTEDLSSLTAKTVADSCTIEVRATNPNYKNTAESKAQLTITKRPVAFTGETDTKDYTGKEIELTKVTPSKGKDEGLVEGHKDDVTYSAKGTEVGEYPGTITAADKVKIMKGSEDVTANYDITTTPGTLTIQQNDELELTVKLEGKEYVYDNEAHALPEVATTNAASGNTTIEYSKDGKTWTADLSSLTAKTVAESCTIQVRATNSNYKNTAESKAKLTITQRLVKFTGETDTRAYTGSEIELTKVTPSTGEGVGLVGGHKDNVTYSAKGTEVGEYPGTITAADKVKIMDGDEDVTANYKIETEAGKLTIEQDKDMELTVSLDQMSYVYDDEAHALPSEATTNAKSGETKIEYRKAATEDAEAGEWTEDLSSLTAKTVAESCTIEVRATNPNYKNEATAKAELTITARPVVFTGETATKDYTGEEIELTKVDINNGDDTGLVKGHEDNVKYSAKGTDVGQYPGTITDAKEVKITKDGEDVTANYDITTTPGTLTIQQNDKLELEVKLEGKEYVYDDEAHALPSEATTNAKSGETKIEYSKDGKTWTADLSSLTAKTVAESCTIQVRATNPNYKNEATAEAELTINQRSVTFTGETDTKDYTGEEIELTKVTPSKGKDEGLVEGHKDDVKYSAKGTEVGEYPGTITDAKDVKITKGEEDVTANYKIETEAGKLTIQQNDKLELEVKLEGKEYVYDGEAHALPKNAEDNAASGTTTIEYSKDGKTWTADLSSLTAKTVADSCTIEVRATNPNYKNEATAEAELTIKPRPVTFEGESDTKDYTGEEIELTKVTPSKGEDEGLVEGHKDNVTYSAKGTEVGEYPGMITAADKVKITKGSEDVTANYDITTTPGKLTITTSKEDWTVDLEGKEYEYDGEAHALPNGATSNAKTGTTTYEYSKDGETWTEDLSSLTAKNVADSFTIKVRATNPNYAKKAMGEAALNITPKAVTVKAQDKAFIYNGEAQSWPEYDVDGLVGDDSIKAEITGSITFVSESPVVNKVESYEFTKGMAANYTVSTNNGKLTMTKADVAITIKAADDEWTYDGKPHENKKVTVKEGKLLKGDTLVASASGSVRNVTDTSFQNNQIADGYKIMHGDEDVTDSYAVTTVAGTLTINPKEISVKVNKAQKVYGEKDPDFTGTVDGLVNDTDLGEIKYKRTNPDENAGIYPKVITADFKENSNYKVTVENADFEIKKAGGNEITPEPGDEDEKLDAEAKNLTVKYDGKAHTVKATATKDGSKIEYKTGGGEWSTDAPSRTNAGTTEFSIRATNPNYKDVVIDGYKLIVTKREVTLTSESDEKVYDGKALTNHKVKVSGDGFADGESAAYTFSGSRTNAGISRNTFDVVDKNGRVMKLQAEADSKGIDGKNYDITKRYGTLTVTKAPLTITTSSASKAYDGKSLTADAKVDGLVNGETVTVNATGSQTEVGSSKNTYSLKWNGTASESNYEITEHLGTLTITESPSDNVDPDPGNNGGNDPSGGKTTPSDNPGRSSTGGNTPRAVNGGTTRTNGALTASTNTSSASTVSGNQNTDPAPQDLTEIEDQKTPLAKTQDKWALLNLILMILTVLLCLWMAAGTLRRNQDADRNEDEKTVKRKKILKLLSLIPAIAAVIAFILTEDMTLPMQMTDKWTILMLIIFVVQVVMRILTKNKKDEEDNSKNAYA